MNDKKKCSEGNPKFFRSYFFDADIIGEQENRNMI